MISQSPWIFPPLKDRLAGNSGALKTARSVQCKKAMNRSRQTAVLSRPTDTLRPFFEPSTIAVIGASRARNKIGSEILHNLVDTGFTGAVVPIHPVAETIQGLKAYARVMDVPQDVDLAVIAVPAAQVAGAVDDCLAKGVPAICIITAGFAECSDAGRLREQELVRRIRAGGARLIRRTSAPRW